MTVLLTLLATMTSLGVFLTLRFYDAKRRRVLKQKARPSPIHVGWLWAGVLFPGFVIMGLGNTSAFICWLAAISLCGWLVALRAPKNDESDWRS